MERQESRKSPRLAVDVPAVAESPNRAFANCNITNSSTDGIFIQCGRSHIGEEALLFTLINSIGDAILIKNGQLSTMVRVVRITDNGLGAVYLH